MKKSSIITYFDSNDYKGFEAYMVDEFNEVETPISKQGSEEYYERYSNWEEMNWSDFMSNLKYSKFNIDCVVVGSLGLWNGTRDIDARRFDTIVDAINTITNVRFIYDIAIKKVNGHLEITQLHHDGTNYFEIHLLNDKGIRASERADLSNKCYHKAIREMYLY